MQRILLTVCAVLFVAVPAPAQVFDEDFDAWPLHTSLGGTLAICPDLAQAARFENLLRRAGEDTNVVLLAHRETRMGDVAGLEKFFSKASVTYGLLEAGSLDASLAAEDAPDLVVLISPTDIVPQGLGGSADALAAYVRGGGRLGLLGGVAQLAGKFLLPDDGDLQAGLNVLPMAVLSVSDADDKRLLDAISAKGRTVGLQLSSEAMLVVRRRITQVVGEGTASFVLPAGPHHSVRRQTLTQRQQGQRAPQFLVDWTEWRRDSIDRTLPKFPADEPPVPRVENGTLLIVGGGGMPAGLMERFVELAGGKEARLVYIPCTEEPEVSPQQGMVRYWERLGVKQATTVHTKDRQRANSDQEFLAPLKNATGVWFGGGRQWNMADSYYGTQAQKLMKDVLARGGVIGGSSAGASIQARYLARATPIENFRIMAPGYERGGLGFIGGVAIDQHFSQRGRQKDMTQLVNRYPQMLGIGLDEATAIEVQKSRATVVGRGRVFFYDRKTHTAEDDPDYVALPAGGVYELDKRKVLVMPSTDEGASPADAEAGSPEDADTKSTTNAP